MALLKDSAHHASKFQTDASRENDGNNIEILIEKTRVEMAEKGNPEKSFEL